MAGLRRQALVIPGGVPRLLSEASTLRASQMQGPKQMTRRHAFASRMADFCRTLVSAGRVASAADAGRMPAARDLARLGISPAAFAAIVRA